MNEKARTLPLGSVRGPQEGLSFSINDGNARVLSAVLGGEAGQFALTEEQLRHHVAVFGASGSGKSKLLELICRTLIDEYRGFCYVDPNGDTAEDVLAYVHAHIQKYQSEAILKRTYWLEPSFSMTFRYDPLRMPEFGELPANVRDRARRQWLDTKAAQIAEVVQRKQGDVDFQQMARLQRILTDVLVAVGTPVNDHGKHLPLSDVFVLLDRHHRRHQDVLNLVMPHLPREVRMDFASLGAYQSERQYKDETESTINRLRSLLSPVVKAIFSCAGDTIDFRKIIQGGGIILVNLRRSDFLSADQRNAIGLMLINQIYSAAEAIPRHERRPFYLLIDEAKLFLSQDMVDALDQARKLQLGVVLAGQHLMQFRRGEVDLIPSIVENCNTIVCFQQKNPDSLEIWQKYFGYPNLHFEVLYTPHDRPDGYEVRVIPEHSVGENETASASLGATRSGQKGAAFQNSEQVSQIVGLAAAEGESHQTQHVDSRGRTGGQSATTQVTHSPIIVDGKVVGMIPITGSSSGENTGEHASSSDGTSDGVNRSLSANVGTATGTSKAQTLSEAFGWALAASLSAARGTSHQVAFKHHFIPKTREEMLPTGKIRYQVSDQFFFFGQVHSVLPRQFALARCFGSQRSAIIRVADVLPIFDDLRAQAALLEQTKQKLYALHPFYGEPETSPEEEEQRLEKFLREAVSRPDPPAAQPGKYEN
jgi:energy-coupling factor transporter ATP-binding protein EcfA2